MTTRIRTLSIAAGPRGNVRRGAVCDVQDAFATELVSKGFAILAPGESVTDSFVTTDTDYAWVASQYNAAFPNGMPGSQTLIEGGALEEP